MFLLQRIKKRQKRPEKDIAKQSLIELSRSSGKICKKIRRTNNTTAFDGIPNIALPLESQIFQQHILYNQYARQHRETGHCNPCSSSKKF